MGVQAATLTSFQKDTSWFYGEFLSLIDQYNGKWIAVKNKKVIAEGDSSEYIVKELEKMGEDPRTTLIKLVDKIFLKMLL